MESSGTGAHEEAETDIGLSKQKHYINFLPRLNMETGIGPLLLLSAVLVLAFSSVWSLLSSGLNGTTLAGVLATISAILAFIYMNYEFSQTSKFVVLGLFILSVASLLSFLLAPLVPSQPSSD